MPPKQKQARQRNPMNGVCGCGSGKKFKKCCFLRNVPADVPHLRMGQIVVDNIWKRFPASNTTEAYWMSKEELHAFNKLLDLWLGFPATYLKTHGVKAASYNAISDIKHKNAVKELLTATNNRMKILPSTPNHFRILGEMARIFHLLRLRVFLLVKTASSTMTEEEEVPESVTNEVEDCLRAFCNMLTVGVYNKGIDRIMEEVEHLDDLPINTTILDSGSASVSILIDISRKRVHEVPNGDANSDVLFWSRSKNRNYSSAFLGALADYIDTEGRPILATEWLCQQKIEHIQCGDEYIGDIVPPLPGSDHDGGNNMGHGTKNWVYMHGSNGNLRYHPDPSFLWKLKDEKENIVGYLHYLSAQFSEGGGTIMTPTDWVQHA